MNENKKEYSVYLDLSPKLHSLIADVAFKKNKSIATFRWLLVSLNFLIANKLSVPIMVRWIHSSEKFKLQQTILLITCKVYS